VRRAALALLLALLVSGCGSGGGPWVRYLNITLPAGVEANGKRAERQGGADPDAGEPIFRLRPREGESIAYAVAVRNLTDREITVTGVVADEDRDGAFVPDAVQEPVRIPPRGRASVAVRGTVHGCQYGGQTVPLAGPELKMRDAEGEETTQQLPLDVVVELIVEGCR
jgi:hypothetical protein